MQFVSLFSFFVQPARSSLESFTQFLAVMIALVVNKNLGQADINGDNFF